MILVHSVRTKRKKTLSFIAIVHRTKRASINHPINKKIHLEIWEDQL